MLDDDQVTEIFGKVTRQHLNAFSERSGFFHERNGALDVAGQRRQSDLGDHLGIVGAQNAEDAFVIHHVGIGNAHIRYGQSIAHAAFACGGNGAYAFLGVLDAFEIKDLGYVLLKGFLRNEVEVQTKTAAHDGRWDLLYFRRGEDEDGVCRRLLQRLQ